MARLGTYDPQNPAPSAPTSFAAAPTGTPGELEFTWDGVIAGDKVVVEKLVGSDWVAVGSGDDGGSCVVGGLPAVDTSYRSKTLRDGKTWSAASGTISAQAPSDDSVYPDPDYVLDDQPTFGPTGIEYIPAFDLAAAEAAHEAGRNTLIDVADVEVGVDIHQIGTHRTGTLAPGVAPAAPTLALVSKSSGQAIFSVAGDAGVTTYIYRRTSGAYIQGASRIGDGSITQTGLSNGTVYEFIAVSFSGTTPSLPSAPLYLMISSSANTPSAPIPAYMEAMRALYAASTNMLGWIHTVGPLETTSGHVILGRYPQTLKDLSTKGPVAVVRMQNFRLDFPSGPKTAVGQLDIVVDHVWYGGNQHVSSDQFIEEQNYIDKIVNEIIGTVGIALDSTYGGSLISIDAPFAMYQDEREPDVMHCQVSYGIRIGKDGN
jgi:hypothetical protein